MKAVILAGGLGTRLSEETHLRPKPMVEIGGRPLLWHIMKIYSSFGVNEFIVCCGYKGYVIKEYFLNYRSHCSDMTIDVLTGETRIHQSAVEPWSVTLVDTGEHTSTGGRLKRIKSYVENEEAFCFTYGDGLADVDISETIKFHEARGKLATLTAVTPPGRFGALYLDGEKVAKFNEKPVGDGGFINGGFFVLSPKVFDYIAGDDTPWEAEPLESLARQGELTSYIHRGFWQPMDTLREKFLLEDLWAKGLAPWKVW